MCMTETKEQKKENFVWMNEGSNIEALLEIHQHLYTKILAKNPLWRFPALPQNQFRGIFPAMHHSVLGQKNTVLKMPWDKFHELHEQKALNPAIFQ